MDDRVDTQIARLRAAETRLKAHMPVAPNLLADTKKFATLCGGRANTEMAIIAGHAGSSFSASLLAGTTARGTIEVVTPANFGAKGLDFEGDLEKAINPRWLGDGGAKAGFIAAGGKRLNVAASGIDFNAVLMDVTITSDQTNGRPGTLSVLGQGRTSKYLTRDSGGFRIQAHCLVTVLEHCRRHRIPPILRLRPPARGERRASRTRLDMAAHDRPRVSTSQWTPRLSRARAA